MGTDTGVLVAGGKYRVLQQVQASPSSRRIEIGTPNCCRYCGQTDPKMFRTAAHTFPEALGNKRIFSRDECDACNQLFSAYEDALATAISPFLTVGGTRGKGGTVRATGRSRGGAQARHRRSSDGKRQLSFIAQGVDLDEYAPVTPDGRHFELKIPLPPTPFRPRHAYKALVKMGLALVPEELLPHYTRLTRWLQDPVDQVDFNVLEVGLSFGSIGNAPPIVSGALLQRVNDEDEIPYLYFLFCAGSVCAQISLKSDDLEDHLPPSHMGDIRIEWASVLGGHPTKPPIRIEYRHERIFNWAELQTQPQPVEHFVLNFDALTTAGSLKPVFRDDEAAPGTSRSGSAI